jgi:sodium/potassium/calcium exchanger 6
MPTPPARKSYRAARAFYLVIAIGLLLAACAAYARQDVDDLGYPEQSLLRRDVNTFTSEEERCRQVHKSKDQCHFIKKHCPDDEGGFGTYLDLFYCRLSHAKPVAFMILISWLGLLFSTIGIAASDFFCINLSTIASILGMSESMAGVTLLAFGNGSPDVFSTFAAMSSWVRLYSSHPLSQDPWRLSSPFMLRARALSEMLGSLSLQQPSAFLSSGTVDCSSGSALPW